jgi:hypothetical protein
MIKNSGIAFWAGMNPCGVRNFGMPILYARRVINRHEHRRRIERGFAEFRTQREKFSL